VTALRSIAEEQKKKISILRDEKFNLQENFEQLELDFRNQTELKEKMKKENKDFKIAIRDIRKDAITKEELIQEQVEEIENLKKSVGKPNYLQDEILMKDHEISNLKDFVQKQDTVKNLQQI
jgi:hypothetical protein